MLVDARNFRTSVIHAVGECFLAQVLPPGWEWAEDENGDIYYFHEDGRSQIEWPEVDEEVREARMKSGSADGTEEGDLVQVGKLCV